MSDINWPDDVPHLIEAEVPEGFSYQDAMKSDLHNFSNLVELTVDTFEDPRARAIVLSLLDNGFVYHNASDKSIQRLYWFNYSYAAVWNYVMSILGYTIVYDVKE